MKVSEDKEQTQQDINNPLKVPLVNDKMRKILEDLKAKMAKENGDKET